MSQAGTRAARVIDRCRELAQITDVAGETTRLFLSPATRDAHTLLGWWFRQAGLTARTDDAGSLRAVRLGDGAAGGAGGAGGAAGADDAPTLVLFSHIDTVPNAGAFDGPLGVVLALAALEEVRGASLPFAVELIAFSEEEGVRFGFPFLSSLAATGRLTAQQLERTDGDGLSVAQAIAGFGLVPGRMAASCPLPERTFAAIEVHIEQGPVLESLDGSLAVVEALVGQSRFEVTFTGQANHAGTTPMPLRRDALVAAAQWVAEVERYAANYQQLVATVGRLSVLPNATNVVPGVVTASLDVRHPRDESRHAAIAHLLTRAQAAGERCGVGVRATIQAEQRAVPLDAALTARLQEAARRVTGQAVPSLFSGAGHDAMILAQATPTAMLFVRSPGGLSHHPEESVREQDVEAALATLIELLLHLEPTP